MFIEARKAGKNIKYYLVHSFRDGKKVIKIRRYLGQNILKEELERKKQAAEIFIKEQIKHCKEIRDPLKTVLSESELENIKNLGIKTSFRIFHLNEKQWNLFSELFSYNTNAIEGSALTEKEVIQLIENNKIPKKNKEDIEEAKGVVNAINFIKNAKEHISLELIKKLHYVIFKDTKTFAGKFREKGVEVAVSDALGNIVHRGAPSYEVENLLKELIQWYDENIKKYPPILLAAVVHNQFENIHPFQDGNGRIGRLLLNNVLLRHNMPPVDIEFTNRREYYDALRAYEHEGNIRPTIELLLKEYGKLKKRLER